MDFLAVDKSGVTIGKKCCSMKSGIDSQNVLMSPICNGIVQNQTSNLPLKMKMTHGRQPKKEQSCDLG